MPKRKSITKKLRFDVFKRDSFKCQYCGKQAPDVVLEIDHIVPVSKGGENDILNLTTSCYDCNRGKRDGKLTENDTLKKQQKELSILSEKQQQLEMMIKWRKELLKANNSEIDKVNDYWEHLTGYGFNKEGETIIKKLIKWYGTEHTLKAMEVAHDKYCKYNGDKIDLLSVQRAFVKIKGIAYISSLSPEMQDRYKKIWYLRNEIESRFDDYYRWQMFSVTKKILESTCDIEQIMKDMQCYTNWDNWVVHVEEIVERSNER